MTALVTLLVMLLVPVLEILVIVQLAGLIGGWWTMAALVATSVLGGWIVRREGRRAWRALEKALRRGTPPDRELSGTALVLAGGLLLVAPGFLTDVAGLLLVLPFTRPVMRRLLTAYGARRLRAAEARGAVFPPGMGGQAFGRYGGPFGAAGDGAAGRPEGRVVQGEVIEDEAVGGDVIEGEIVKDDDRRGRRP
ncbi:FxsA family protein [Actinomadura sp. SCN-SB]|uniref:FxsA family protein n=1 Tax=Actinomadura sp. SCN-SB TaxID=3373092 RepID=UPI003753E56A